MSDATVGSISYKFTADTSEITAAFSRIAAGVSDLTAKMRNAAAGMRSGLDDVRAASARISDRPFGDLDKAAVVSTRAASSLADEIEAGAQRSQRALADVGEAAGAAPISDRARSGSFGPGGPEDDRHSKPKPNAPDLAERSRVVSADAKKMAADIQTESQKAKEGLDKIAAGMTKSGQIAHSSGELMKEGFRISGESAAQSGSKIAMAAHGSKAALEAETKAAGLNMFQKMELMHVTRALTDEIVAGGSPLRALAMEGGRINEILQQGQGGVGGTLKSIGSIMTGLLTPTRLLTLGLVGLGAAGAASAYSWQASQDRMSNALNGLGRRTGLGPLQLQSAATQGAMLSNGGAFGAVSIGQARDLAATFAHAGVDGPVIPQLIAATPKFAGVAGVDREEAGTALAQAFADPVKGLEELNKVLGFADAELTETVRRFMAVGDAASAEKAMAEALTKDLEDVHEASNSVARGFRDLKNSAANWWSGLGRGIMATINPTDQQRLEQLREHREQLEREQASPLGQLTKSLGLPNPADGDLKRTEQEISQLEASLAEEEKKAADKKAQQEERRRSEEERALENLRQKSQATVTAIQAFTLGEKTLAQMELARLSVLEQTKDSLRAAAEAEGVRNRLIAEASHEAIIAAEKASDNLRLAGLRPSERAHAQIDIDAEERFRKLDLRDSDGKAIPDLARAAAPRKEPEAKAQAPAPAVPTVPIPASVTSPAPNAEQAQSLEALTNRLEALKERRAALEPKTGKPSPAATDVLGKIDAEIERLEKSLAELRLAIEKSVSSGATEPKATVPSVTVEEPGSATPEAKDGAANPAGQMAEAHQEGVQAYRDTTRDQHRAQTVEETIAPLRAATDAINEQAKALDLEATAFGKSTAEIAKANEIQKLYNEYHRQGIAVTDALATEFEKIGTAAGALAQSQKDLGEKMNGIAQARSLSQGVFSTFANDLAHGKRAADALKDSLHSLQSKLVDMATNKLFNGLFGDEKTGAGGLLSPMLGKLLGLGDSAKPSGIGLPEVTRASPLFSGLLSNPQNGGIASGAATPSFRPIGAAGVLPLLAQPRGGDANSLPSIGSAGSLPLLAQGATKTFGTTFEERDAYARQLASAKGLDPNFITGLGLREGALSGNFKGVFDPSKSGAPGTSYGQYQLREPGLGTTFREQTGLPLNESTWREQAQFVTDYIARHGAGPWSAVRDNGGIEGLTRIGRDFYARHGGAPSITLPTSDSAQAATPDLVAPLPPVRPLDLPKIIPPADAGLPTTTTGAGALVKPLASQVLKPLEGLFKPSDLASALPASSASATPALSSGLGNPLGGIGGLFSSLFGALFGGFRAEGGPVAGGKSYVVGERGPELFSPPPGGGHIVPNNLLFGGFRAEGGPVAGGKSYVVGERGPEAFYQPGGAAVGGTNDNSRSSFVHNHSPTYNIDARGSQHGVGDQIKAAIEAHDRQINRTFMTRFKNSQLRFADS